MTKHAIHGQVIDATTHQPLYDLRVEAWDRGSRSAKRLGSAVTAADGKFAIELERSRPDIYFHVFCGEHMLADTKSQVVWNSRYPDVPVVIAVHGAGAVSVNAQATASEVNGIVTTATGVAVADVRVEIWDQHLSGETLLATGITDARGNYLDNVTLGRVM
jgi:5-hydroxyisourate hydrolase-like protein (transthyretin family)